MHVVTNTLPRLVTFATRKDPVTKRRKITKLLPFQSIEVDDATFDRWMNTTLGRTGGIQEGRIKGPQTAAPNIGKAKEDDAIRFVKSTTDLRHLAEWARTEERAAVKAAILMQQATLTPPPK